MDYRLEPARVGTRRDWRDWRGPIFGIVLATGIVLMGLGARFGGSAVAHPIGAPPRAAIAWPHLSGDLTCHELSRVTCVRVALAAIAILPEAAPRVVGAEAWSSLICADQYDCPPGFLDGPTVPLGSVALRMEGVAARTRINVIGRAATRPNAAAIPTSAWAVSWR